MTVRDSDDKAVDIDAMLRDQPPRAPSAERARVMRSALLAAAEATPAAGWRDRRWRRGALLAGALAAAAALVLMLRGAPAPAPMPATTQGGAPVAQAVAPAAADRAPDRAPDRATPALAASDTLADGTTVVQPHQPMRWSDHEVTLTAPPDARFVVDVQNHRVRSIAVMSGWVVVAGAKAPARMIVEREMWTAPALVVAAPEHVTSAPPALPAPATPRRPDPPEVPAAITMSTHANQPDTLFAPHEYTTPTPATIADGDGPRVNTPAAATAEHAPNAPNEVESARAAPPAPEPAKPADHTAEAAAELAFRDGLHALLAGDAHAAGPALARACAASSSVLEDSCYWSAVASSRAGDRPQATLGFQGFLARWPGSTHAGEAHVQLGWLLLTAGSSEAARAQFTAAQRDALASVRDDAKRGLARLPQPPETWRPTPGADGESTHALPAGPEPPRTGGVIRPTHH